VRDQVVQYRDVGTQLTIRPTINPDGYVTLSVLQEVNTATAESQFGAPIISTREAETRLLVKDGNTVVIGGLIDQQRTSANSGIPFLRDIPVLGNLFRSTQRRNTTTELFLFLIPHVLRTDEDVEDATARVRERAPRLDRVLPDSIPLLWGPADSAAVRPARPAPAPRPTTPGPSAPPSDGPMPALPVKERE
jgi:type II secretory pathway component GspD/PulD (secretin)